MPVFTSNSCEGTNHKTACGLYQPGFYKIVNPAGPPPGNKEYLGIIVELAEENTEDIVLCNHNMDHDTNYLELTSFEYLKFMTYFAEAICYGDRYLLCLV